MSSNKIEINTNTKVFWDTDKVLHYDLVYNFIKGGPKVFRMFKALLAVGVLDILKEEIADGIFRLGSYDQGDKLANQLAAHDAINQHPKRYLQWGIKR